MEFFIILLAAVAVFGFKSFVVIPSRKSTLSKGSGVSIAP